MSEPTLGECDRLKHEINECLECKWNARCEEHEAAMMELLREREPMP